MTWTAGTIVVTAYEWSHLGAPSVDRWAVIGTPHLMSGPAIVDADEPFPASPPPDIALNLTPPPIAYFTIENIEVTDTGETQDIGGFLHHKYAIAVTVNHPARYYPYGDSGFDLEYFDIPFPGDLFNIFVAGDSPAYSAYGGPGIDDDFNVMADYDDNGLNTGTGEVTRSGITLNGSLDFTPLPAPVDTEITHYAWQARGSFRGPLTRSGGFYPAVNSYPFDLAGFEQELSHLPLPEYADTLTIVGYAFDQYGRPYSTVTPLETFAIPSQQAAGVIDAHGDLYSAAIEWDNDEASHQNYYFPVRRTAALQSALVKTVSDFTREGGEPQGWNDDDSQFKGDAIGGLVIDDAGNLWLLWRNDAIWFAMRSLNSGQFYPISAGDFLEFDFWTSYAHSHFATLPLGIGIGAVAIGKSDAPSDLVYASWHAAIGYPTYNGETPIGTLSYGDERDEYGAPTRSFTLLTQEADDASWLYCTDGVDFLFESRDLGATWQPLELGTDWAAPFDGALFGCVRLCALSDGTFAASAVEYQTGYAWFARSQNGWKNWTAPESVAQLNDRFPCVNIAQLHLAHSSQIAIWNGGDLTGGGIAVSKDFGATWAAS